MKDELSEALANGELEIYYQPKYSLATGQMTGVEALARWESPTTEFVPPDIFVPVAERVGLIDDLTAFVMKGAATPCQRWREMRYDLSASVNLSAMDLSSQKDAVIVKVQVCFLCRPLDAVELERRLPFIYRFRPVPDSPHASDPESKTRFRKLQSSLRLTFRK